MVTSMRSVDILLVEDNLGDVRLTQEVFSECNIATNLHVTNNGTDAVQFLRQEGKYSNFPRPSLILLDLYLPGMSGHEVLNIVKNDACLKYIPVVVLTASDAEEDILQSYDMHANCYVSKPITLEKLQHTVEGIREFWLKVTQLL